LSDGCYSCQGNARVGSLPPREEIFVDDHWRVAHAFGSRLPGWLVVVPRRHVLALDDLSVEEMSGLGPLLRSLTSALRSVTGCEKTYVVLYAEAEGYAHVHFHVVPRMPGFTREQRGPRSIDAFLGATDDAVPDEEMDRIGVAIRDALRAQPV
jgi:diadenosine tetraphosphate (Ap4A) HIT family hydrolase